MDYKDVATVIFSHPAIGSIGYSEEKATEVFGADKIKVYQISTDEKLNPMQATLQTTERDSLFDALDLANAWLRRAEKATQQEKKN